MSLMVPAAARSIPARWLLIALVSWLAADLLLLQPFLGKGGIWALGLWPGIAVLVVWGVTQGAATMPDRIGWRTLAICGAVSLTLLLLGGEGRLFHANYDWRVRDAVLHDMAVNRWPFAYTFRGLPEVLRAPLGLYLVPALAMKAGGQAAGDWTLLVQNALILTMILSLGSTLFAPRVRAIALGVFVVFSGLDVVGGWLAAGERHRPLADHLESWATPLQYTSHVTQLFWVPQHALAGWIGALGYALWREGRLPVGVFLSLVPLSILWSPLGALGALPFAALAGATALARRQMQVRDVALPALACLLAGPALLYLTADVGAVGARPVALRWSTYIAFVSLEVLPLVLVASWTVRMRPFGHMTLALIAAMLLLLPFGQVGAMADFVMRVSIAPLALLALAVADAVATVRGARLALALALLAGGAVTGLHEVRRALTFPRSPPPLCTFFTAWGPSPPSDKSTYLAPVVALPNMVRPDAVTLVPHDDPPRCWAGPWPKPLGAME